MKTTFCALCLVVATAAGCQQATAEGAAPKEAASDPAGAQPSLEPALVDKPVLEPAPAAAEPVAAEPAKEGEGKADGKTLFTELKCAACHTAAAGGIPAEEKKLDLPGKGGTYEPAWMKAYLLKEQKIGERTHPTKMGGDEAKQTALVDWVCALKK